MRMTTLGRILLSATLPLLAVVVLQADDKKGTKAAPALTGTWKKADGELKIEFSEKDVMKIMPHGNSDVIVVVCKYTVTKDGVVKAKLTELEGKEKEKAKQILPANLEFSFRWKATNATAEIDDLKGDNVDTIRSHMEGKYEQK